MKTARKQHHPTFLTSTSHPTSNFGIYSDDRRVHVSTTASAVRSASLGSQASPRAVNLDILGKPQAIIGGEDERPNPGAEVPSCGKKSLQAIFLERDQP